jgi:hypothetical protein
VTEQQACSLPPQVEAEVAAGLLGIVSFIELLGAPVVQRHAAVAEREKDDDANQPVSQLGAIAIVITSTSKITGNSH